MEERILEYEKEIGYHFRNPSLLQNALTHSSYCMENQLPAERSYERLEFLGDAYLDAVISSVLYEKKIHSPEGSLSKLRSEIVCEKACAEIAEKLEIGKYLILGNGEERTGGREKTSILADAVESTIAAVFLDGGYEEARAFILREFTGLIDRALSGKLFQDYKTKLQEKLQKEGTCPKIEYKTVRETGPDHNKTFQVALIVNGNLISHGMGKSKKEAQQDAARAALSGEKA